MRFQREIETFTLKHQSSDNFSSLSPNVYFCSRGDDFLVLFTFAFSIERNKIFISPSLLCESIAL